MFTRFLMIAGDPDYKEESNVSSWSVRISASSPERGKVLANRSRLRLCAQGPAAASFDCASSIRRQYAGDALELYVDEKVFHSHAADGALFIKNTSPKRFPSSASARSPPLKRAAVGALPAAPGA